MISVILLAIVSSIDVIRIDHLLSQRRAEMRVTEVSHYSMAGSFSALAQRLRRLPSRVQVAAMAVRSIFCN